MVPFSSPPFSFYFITRQYYFPRFGGVEDYIVYSNEFIQITKITMAGPNPDDHEKR